MFEAKRSALLKNLDAAHAAYYKASMFSGPSLYFHVRALAAARAGDLTSFSEQILVLAREPAEGRMFAPTAHHFMEFLQQGLPYDPRGVLHLAAEVTLAAEGGGYHLDSMAASETVKLAERILADYRSELREEGPMSDMVQLLDMFAKVGWPDALALLWRLDEVFR